MKEEIQKKYTWNLRNDSYESIVYLEGNNYVSFNTGGMVAVCDLLQWVNMIGEVLRFFEKRKEKDDPKNT